MKGPVWDGDLFKMDLAIPVFHKGSKALRSQPSLSFRSRKKSRNFRNKMFEVKGCRNSYHVYRNGKGVSGNHTTKDAARRAQCRQEIEAWKIDRNCLCCGELFAHNIGSVQPAEITVRVGRPRTLGRTPTRIDKTLLLYKDLMVPPHGLEPRTY